MRVFGRWKVVVKRTFFTLCELTYKKIQASATCAERLYKREGIMRKGGYHTPLRAAFAAALALPFFSPDLPLPAVFEPLEASMRNVLVFIR